MKGQRGNPGLKGRLVDKSVEAYILALETINRLSIKYRLEAFCYLLCNAWELLLKAKILEDMGKVDEAKEALAKAIVANPQDEALLTQLERLNVD